MKRGFYTIMAAQFLSSLADNALLIAAIALLQSLSAPPWMTPLLKLFFVISYIALAAWVGSFADLFPKGRVMMITNLIKVVGCLLMLFGSHPLLSYAVVGIGAAAYSPAKYGILTELLPPEQLVVANGWIESLTVVSIILGVVLGGALVHPDVAESIATALSLSALGVRGYAETAIFVTLLIYAAAAVTNVAIPDTGARYPRPDFRPVPSLKHFFGNSFSLLWRDPLGQISLSVTTLFWGAGAVLQFLVLKWAGRALGMTLSQAAMLQGVVSLGIAAGAVLAALLIPLRHSLRVLPIGIVMGLLTAAASGFHESMLPGGFQLGGLELRYSVLLASLLMVLVGACAGFFVVPMNALLQHRGHVLMSAGRSIAVQNFNENVSILTMLGAYALLVSLDIHTPTIMLCFGLFVAASVALVMVWHGRNQRRRDSLGLIGEARRH